MDNHRRGLVADFLKAKTKEGSRLSVVSAYFTIYAYEALKDHLDRIEHLDFLFGEPRFISSLDPDKTEKKAFKRANTTGDISTLEHKLDAKISRLYGLTPEEIKTVEEST
jgi:hypothetical protein